MGKLFSAATAALCIYLGCKGHMTSGEATCFASAAFTVMIKIDAAARKDD